MNKTIFAISLAAIATTAIATTTTTFTEENYYDQWYGVPAYSTPVARANVIAPVALDVKLVDEETFHAQRFDGTKAPAPAGNAMAIIDEETYHALNMGVMQTEPAQKVSIVGFDSIAGCQIKSTGQCV
jgi:hypothetical protein